MQTKKFKPFDLLRTCLFLNWVLAEEQKEFAFRYDFFWVGNYINKFRKEHLII